MKRRILYTIDGMGTGGAERSLAELLPGVEAAGWRPTVACLFRRREGVQDDLLAAGADIRFLPGRGASKSLALRRLLRELRPSLVHSTLFQATMTTRAALPRGGPPLVTSLVSTPYDRARLELDPSARPGFVRLVQQLDRGTAGRTARFHAITHAVKEAAVRDLRLDAGRITVIERGRDSRRLGEPSAARTQRARAALGIADHHRVVVNVGRLEYSKGQRYLLEAAALLANTHPEAVVLIAGRAGTASAELERLSDRLSLGDRVRFLGHRTDVPDVLAAADVFVFPSLYEGLGGVLIEAMALGLPIVASDIPATREVLEAGANADMVPAGHPAALADALGAMLDDPERAWRYGLRSRQRFETCFTLEVSTARMLALYGEVLAAHPAEQLHG